MFGEAKNSQIDCTVMHLCGIYGLIQDMMEGSKALLIVEELKRHWTQPYAYAKMEMDTYQYVLSICKQDFYSFKMIVVEYSWGYRDFQGKLYYHCHVRGE